MDTTTTAGTPSTVQGGQAGRQHSAGLVEFVEKLEDIHPVVPDELTKHALVFSGVSCDDERTVRLFSLAGEMFLDQLIDEARIVQQNRMQAPQKHQQAEGFSTGAREKRSVLLTEDIAVALQEYGMRLYKPSFVR